VTDCIPQLVFSFYRHRPIHADFSGGQITSDAGLLPLRAFDERHQLTRDLAETLSDPRQDDRVRHDSLALLRQRIYQIVAGYEDANDADRLTSVTDAASHVTYYAYDTEDNLTSISDANSNQTAFTYDAFGRVTRTNFPSSLSENYQYDADNNLTSKTDRKNQTITYLYDALNRLTSKTYPDSTAVDYVYDLVGKIQ
jgi:YD repeat-containing protein